LEGKNTHPLKGKSCRRTQPSGFSSAKHPAFIGFFALARPLLSLPRRMNSELLIGEAAKDSAEHTDIHLPFGLLGFERIKNYSLIPAPRAAPFSWLQMAGDPSLAFLVISPDEVLPTYFPEISEEDVDYLDLTNPDDAGILNIVTLHPGGSATVNLKGPIVYNRNTLIGKQVVLLNATEYALKYSLPLAP